MSVRSVFYGFLMVMLCAAHEGGARAKDFVVMAVPQQPFKYVDGDQPKGIDVDVVREIFRRLDVPYRVQFVRSGTRILHEARAGRADMLMLFSKKVSRLAFLDYPEQSYMNITWNFFIRREDIGRIRYDTLPDLLGLKVGATRDHSYTPEFWQAGLRLDMSANDDVQVRKLLAKRFDVVPLNTIGTMMRERSTGNLSKLYILPKPLKSKKYYNAFAKASSHPKMGYILANYDRVVARLKREGVIDRILQAYLGDHQWLGADAEPVLN